MKRPIFFIMLLASAECNAATGNASDGELFAVIAILVVMLPIATVYIVDFLKSRIKDLRERKQLEKHLMDHNGENGI